MIPPFHGNPDEGPSGAFTPVTAEVDLTQDALSLALVGGALGGVALAVWSGPEGWLAVVLGALVSVGCLAALAPRLVEAVRRFTPERFVAGIMAAGMVFVAAGLAAGGNRFTGAAFMPGAVVLVGLGAGLFVLGLAVGLVWAFLPDLVPARVYRGVVLQDRYGLDERHMVVGDHPCPWEDRMTPVVRFRTAEGKAYTLPSAPTAYEFARPGSTADVRVRKNRLVEVTVTSRDPQPRS